MGWPENVKWIPLPGLLLLSCLSVNSGAAGQPPVLAFEARGAAYVSHGAGYELSVTSGGAVLIAGGRAVRVSAAGARRRPLLEGVDRMAGKAHYILGHDVRASYDLYGGVRWRGIYSGIDVVFRGNRDRLEYDFEIAAGRDAARIRLVFDGIDDLRIDHRGDLILRAGAVTIHQPKPVAFQIRAGQRQAVDAAYWIDASKHIRFRTGPYDRRRPLVIDPQVLFEKVFGGSGQSVATGLARDSRGGLYVTGSTNSTDWGTVNPAQSHLGTAPLLETADAGKTWNFPSLGGATTVFGVAAAPFVPLTMYAATSAGVFQSADGGASWTASAGDGLAAQATSLAVDAGSATTVYAGTTQGLFVSTDGAASWRPSTNGIAGAGIETVAAHPSQAGTVFASVQSPPALYRSTDFGQSWTQLTIAPPNQAVPPVAILFSPGGTIILATPTGLLLSMDGGNTWTADASQGAYNSQALAISPTNPVTLFLVGQSGLERSTDGGQTFSPLSLPVQITSFGRVAVDPRNPAAVYVADASFLDGSTDGGQTWASLALPYSIAPQCLFVSPADSRLFVGSSTRDNVFVTKWSADGSQVLYSTYLGGSGSDWANAIAVDASGSAYVTGYTFSPDFPTTSGAFQTKFSGEDVFVAKLSPDGSKLVYSTLLGASSGRPAGIAVDSAGEAVITGSTQAGFPVTANAFQTAPVAGCNVQIPFETYVPSGDAFVTKIAAGGDALVYSTLLGGNCATYGTSVTLDASGNAWVTGSTISTDFPVTRDALQSEPGGGYYDGYLARFDPSGGLAYATYIGGPGYDSLNAISLDSSGNVYLAGESGGLSQPASAGAFQPQVSANCPFFSIGPAVYSPQGNGVVLKLDPAAHSILRLTYLGAPSCLSPSSIAVDSAGEPWIAGGFTAASTLQTANPVRFALGQGYISKFSADFTQLLFSTYFDSVSGLALDSSGLAYVAGTGPYNASGAEPVYVAQVDPTPAAISLDSIASVVPSVNPSNYTGIAAGELIRLLGRNMGPAAAVPGSVAAGVLVSAVAGVQVTFDGVAAPLLWVSAQEIDLVTPFELATKSTTTVQVQYNGNQSNAVEVAVNAADLQILGVFNEDFSVNSASNPAQAGSVMTLYVAGAGPTNPPSQDGQINAAPLAGPATPIQVEWLVDNPSGVTTLPITYAGAAPGLAAGIFQVNFIAPQQSLAAVNVLQGTSFGVLISVFVRQ